MYLAVNTSKLLLKFLHSPSEAGTDEAGRGCLAGPVTAAAVILPEEFENDSLNDSKKLTAIARERLKKLIEQEAICFAVAHISPAEIDRMNILNASIDAMHLALKNMNREPEFILVDGNRFRNYGSIPHSCIIKGDGKYRSIAAASILAKTHRDAYMARLHEEFPMYNWLQNKGYPTKDHREAIRRFGITKYHRRSFRLLPEQLELPLNF